VITLELGEAVHAAANALHLARLRLDHALLLAADATADERVKLCGPLASGLAGMLDAIEVATRPAPAGAQTEDEHGT